MIDDLDGFVQWKDVDYEEWTARRDYEMLR